MQFHKYADSSWTQQDLYFFSSSQCVVNQESLSNQLNEQATFVFFLKKKEETKYFVLRIFFTHANRLSSDYFSWIWERQVPYCLYCKDKDFPPIALYFPSFFWIQKFRQRALLLQTIWPLQGKKKIFLPIFWANLKKNYRKVSAPACSRFPRIYINSRRLKQVTADCLGFHLMAERDFVGFYPWNYQICFPLGCPDVRNSVDVCNFPLYIMCETSECCKTNASEDVKKTYQ